MQDIKLSEKISNKYKPDSDIFSLYPPVPLRHVQIEISNLCNYRCIFCPRIKSVRKKGMIDDALFNRLVQEVYDFGAREMSFHYSGDPFLHPKLSEYVRKAKQVGYSYVYIDTNGSGATPEKIKDVIDAGVDSIKFSVNAGTRESYQFIHGVDAFDKVVEYIVYCNEYRKKVNPRMKLFVSCVYTKYTEHEKKKVVELFPFCDEVIFQPAADFSGVMPEVNELLKGEGDNNYSNKCPCPMIFGGIYITYEGYLSACCTNFDNHVVVADLNKVSLKEAWYGEKMTELRKRHLENNLRGLVCYNCVYHKKECFEALCPEYARKTSMHNYYDNSIVEDRVKTYEAEAELFL